MKFKVNSYVKVYGLIFIGTLIFCLGNSLFIVPAGLYSGGVVGVSQVLRTIFIDKFKLPIPPNFEIAGFLNFVINLPLFFIAYKNISKSFFLKTIFSIILQTIFFAIIPIPQNPIFSDMLSSCIVGGVISGVGVGLIFGVSGSTGGTDILGFYFTQKNKNFSVGKLTIILNVILYSVCAILFDIQTALYSVICIVVFSLVIDRIHIKNINTMAIVFTKNKEIPKDIIEKMHRGVTMWNGQGAYTMNDMLIFITVISKYEINNMKSIVHKKDPSAFIIFSERTGITGNFEKRL